MSYTYTLQTLLEAELVEQEPGRGKYRRRRERQPLVGMLAHLDASTHEWLAGLGMRDLVIALDDADGQILYSAFFAEEGTASTFVALGAALREHGRFWSCIPTAAANSAALSRRVRIRPKSKTARSVRCCAPWNSPYPRSLSPGARTQ